ncbi:MAG: hypothetical protein LC793_06780, partial [Thermomicrobia bacterium]|nr:hypothetical protein [Thermomicrobia bacterium]
TIAKCHTRQFHKNSSETLRLAVSHMRIMEPHDKGGDAIMADWTRDDVITAIKRDFPDGGMTGILSVLDRYGSDLSERGRARVQIAILKLSDGDLTKLRHNTEVAIQDYRDVLWWSDTPIEPE